MATPAKSAADNTKAPAGAAGETDHKADMVLLPGKKVRRRFNWRPFSGGPEYTKEAVFDFSGCTEEQVLFLAMYGATVKVQAMLRDSANASKDLKVDPALFANVNVLTDVVLASTKAKDPVASAVLAARKAGADEATIKALADALGRARK